MFVDLVGSTSLSERLDPEDMGELYVAYRESSTRIIEDYGGFVAQFLGDGILVYFGFPRAHDEDAVRAVRAALDIGPAVQRLDGGWNRSQRVQLDVRAGLHSGVVVAGALGTGVKSDQLAVVGGTSNVAARIQNYAQPGEVMITGATWQLIEGRFECEDLGRHPMRGVREPVHILRVLRPSTRLTRFEAAKEIGELVDREEELARLLDCWSRACDGQGQGQVVQVRGEPGIGKSRLLRAFEERIAARPHDVIRCQCTALTMRSTLQPIIVGLQRAAGFLPDDSPEERLDKLEALLTAAGMPIESGAPLYAALLSLPFGQRYPRLDLSPARQMELTLATLVTHVRALAGQQPLLVVIEDVHWTDPTSLELLRLLVEAISDRPVLIVLAMRPEFAEDLGASEPVTIDLRPLSVEDSRTLIDWATGGRALPPDLATEVVRKTDGIPLFIQELTRAILEAGTLVERSGRLEQQGTQPPLSIPATLQESLLARLDRLGPAKEVAQIAATVGQEVSHRLLTEISGLASRDLDDALGRLSEADLIWRRSTPSATYVFRHVLIRDMAYGSLIRPRRQELHSRIAAALPRCEPDTVVTEPERMAHHLTEAGRLDEAVEWWRKAGQRASAISANAEAVHHFSRGLELLKQLPDDEGHHQQALDLLIRRGPAQIVLLGAATDEVAANYAEALALAKTLPESTAHFAANWGWWFISANNHEQERRGSQLLELAARLGDKGLVMQAHHCQWAVQLDLGKLVECRRHIDDGLALYDAGAYDDELTLYGGHDAKVCGLGNAAIVTWLLGDTELAQRRVREVLDWAPRTGHAASRAHALESTSTVAYFSRDHETLKARASQLAALAEEHGFAGYQAKAMIYLGWAVAQQGEVLSGLQLVREGLAKFQAVSTDEDSPLFTNIYAELLAMSGAVDEALGSLDQVIEEMERGSLQLWLPELQHHYGKLLATRHPSRMAEPEAWFLRAVRTAHLQGARALRDRALSSLAHNRRLHGGIADEARLLAEALDGADNSPAPREAQV